MVSEEESCDCALVDCDCASGDGSFARKARLHNPSSITLTMDGSLYIADQFNLRIRKVNECSNEKVLTTNVFGSYCFHPIFMHPYD